MTHDADMKAFETMLRASIARDVATFIRTHQDYRDEELLEIIWRSKDSV
jgi:hypothetical protein